MIAAHEGRAWWTPVRVVLAVACVAWVLAIAQKAPCAVDGFSGGNERYAKMCYSDMPFLYVPRGFAERVVPFTDTGGRYPDLEYPVGIGYFAYASAVATQALGGGADPVARAAVDVEDLYADPEVETERRGYFWVNAAMLAPFALLATYALARAHPRRPYDSLAFAASPLLVLTGLVNWDLLAVAATAWALYGWSRGRSWQVGVAVGLGTAAKLYPLFLLGPIAVMCARERRWADLVKVMASSAAAWLALNLPAIVTDFEAWAGFWNFNADRAADLGSLWLVSTQLGHDVSAGTINTVSQAMFLVACLGIAWLAWSAPRTPRLAQLGFLVIAAFLIVNKVYSPQYVLWLLPLAVLARPRARDLAIWQIGEVVYFAAVWLYLGGFLEPSAGQVDWVYQLAIIVRVAAQLYFCSRIVADILHPERSMVDGLSLDHPVEAGRREAHLNL